MGQDWDAAVYRDKLHYRDVEGRIDTPLPRMPGSHQSMNAALAIAMLRPQKSIAVSEAAIKAAPLWAHWPPRPPRLELGPLADLVPNTPILLAGGLNHSTGERLGKHFYTHLPLAQ